MKIIVNADDFGKNSTVNKAIVHCFKHKLISNTTIMVNMPGFDEAVKLAKDNDFFDKVGLHLNFFAGIPLTEEMKMDSILCKNGVMTSEIFYHRINLFKRLKLNKTTKRNIKLECEAQVKKFIESGFTQRHLDSHGHSHTIMVFWKIIRKILKRYGFSSTRISENVSPNKRLISKFYKWVFNNIATSSFRRPRYFCSLADFDMNLITKNVLAEIMVHPDFEGRELVNRYGKRYVSYTLLDSKISACLIDFNMI